MKKKLKIIGVFLNPYILWIIIYAILLGIGALILS